MSSAVTRAGWATWAACFAHIDMYAAAAGRTSESLAKGAGRHLSAAWAYGLKDSLTLTVGRPPGLLTAICRTGLSGAWPTCIPRASRLCRPRSWRLVHGDAPGSNTAPSATPVTIETATCLLYTSDA